MKLEHITNKWIDRVNQLPFKHFSCHSELPTEYLDALLAWFERDAPWKRVNESFYDQYEFSLFDAKIPSKLSFLTERFFLDELIQYVESLFSTKLAKQVDVVAHKLISGDLIKIHNDFIEGQETHRILFHINRSWTEEFGGYFMIFYADDPECIHDVIPPKHGSVHGFEISENSHHAVSKVHGGERFTLIYSFYKQLS